jgi:hypothetical protein
MMTELAWSHVYVFMHSSARIFALTVCDACLAPTSSARSAVRPPRWRPSRSPREWKARGGGAHTLRRCRRQRSSLGLGSQSVQHGSTRLHTVGAMVRPHEQWQWRRSRSWYSCCDDSMLAYTTSLMSSPKLDPRRGARAEDLAK